MGSAQVLAGLRRRWPVVVVALLVGALLGGLYGARSTPEYRSTTSVFFSLDRGSSVNEFTAGSTYAQDLVPSYAQIVTTPLVLDPVIGSLRLPTTSTALAKQITVAAQANTVLMDITVTNSSSATAASVANAVARQLVTAVAGLSPRGGVDAPRIRVTLTSPAVPSASPSSTSPVLVLAAGLVAGLLVGMAFAVLLELQARPMRTRAAVAAVTPAPVVGSIVRQRDAARNPVPTVTDPFSPRAERFRILRTNLQYGSAAAGTNCVVVTSATPREGRTGVAVNLAAALAGASQRVILVDADFRAPRVHTLLGIDGRTGLAGVLTGAHSLDSAVQQWGEPSISVLPAGALLDSPGELLAGQAMVELLQALRTKYDMVVIDATALLPVADAGIVAGHVGSALLVIDSRRTGQRQVAEAVDRLEMAGSRVSGVVLNNVPGRRGRYLRLTRSRRARPAASAAS